MSRNRSNSLVVPQAKMALDQLKFEIAQEHGIMLQEGYNGHITTRDAGTIGGNITKRLVQMAEQSMGIRR